MKVKALSILAVALAMAGVFAPAALAQGIPFASGSARGSSRQQTAPPTPNTSIIPSANPIVPMSNPIGPFIASPFIRYAGTTPTVVIPEQSRNDRRSNTSANANSSNNGRQGQRGRDWDVVYVPVAVPYYYPTYNYYPEIDPTPVTIPGQLPAVPGSRYDYTGPTSFNPKPDAPLATPPSSSFAYEPQSHLYSEPRVIVNELRPNRVVEALVAGASRAAVIARLGQPWGQFTSRGIETLYFDGLTVVIAPDGRVAQVR